MSRQKSPPPPLDPASIERLALRYVERFATTRAKLADYLRRKLRERGWAGEDAPPVDALAARFAELGYIDDRAFGEMRAAALSRRGMGARRVRQALDQAGVRGEDAASIDAEVAERAIQSAVIFARRKRIGPFAHAIADRAMMEKQVGQMVRAGHSPDLARRIVRLTVEMLEMDAKNDIESQLVRSLS